MDFGDSSGSAEWLCTKAGDVVSAMKDDLRNFLTLCWDYSG